MKRISGQALAWLAATVASVLLATSAVSSVGDEVTTRPSPLRVPAATVAAAATGTSAPSTPQTAIQVPATVPNTTTTLGGSGSSTTVLAPAATTPPESTSTTTPSTTTAAPDGDYFESFQLIGGWVRLRVSAGEVYLAGTVPAPGFTVEIEKNGPRAVEVEFSSSEHESKLQAEISDGELEVETSEEED